MLQGVHIEITLQITAPLSPNGADTPKETQQHHTVSPDTQSTPWGQKAAGAGMQIPIQRTCSPPEANMGTGTRIMLPQKQAIVAHWMTAIEGLGKKKDLPDHLLHRVPERGTRPGTETESQTGRGTWTETKNRTWHGLKTGSETEAGVPILSGRETSTDIKTNKESGPRAGTEN